MKGNFAVKRVGVSRLASIGGIALSWNIVEVAVDTALGSALELHPNMWNEVFSRVQGFDAKIQIIKRAALVTHKLSEEDYRTIADTLGTLGFYKQHRDAVVHARILNARAAVAPSFQQKGKTIEVLVSAKALDELHQRLEVVSLEASLVTEILFQAAVFRGKISPKRPTKREMLQASKLFRGYMAQLRKVQRLRQSLPPLPEFPEECPSPPDSEEKQEPQD